jgi:hypothetical protein
MPDVFDQLPDTPTGDVFDQLPAGTQSSSTWNYILDAAQRMASGVGRGLGLPESLPTSVAEAQKLSDSMNPILSRDPLALAGPVPGAIRGWFGNLQDAKRRIDAGDVAGGGAQGVTSILPLLGLTDTEPTGSTPDTVTAAVKEPVHPTIKKLTEVMSPPDKQVPRFQTAAATAVPALKEFEPTVGPISLNNWRTAEQLAEAKRNAAADSFIEPARQNGVKVDGNIVANAKIDAIPRAWINNPKFANQYKAAIDDAATYRRPMDIDEVTDAIKYNNSRLTPFYKASPDQQYAMQAAGFPVADLEAEASGLRNGLSKAVDPEHNGQQFQQIRNEQSGLITFRQQAEALENKLQKQYTPTTLEKAGQAISDLGSVWHGDFRQALTSKVRQAPTLDKSFADAFKNYDGPNLPETPRGTQTVKQSLPFSPDMVRHDPLGMTHLLQPPPNPFDAKNPLAPPTASGGSDFLSQLASGRSSDPLGVNHLPPNPYTHQFGGPAPQYDPVQLTHPPGSPRFIRQRDWSEVLTDPRTLANEGTFGDVHGGTTEVGQHRLDLKPTPHGEFLRQLGLDEQ